jgi:hypothetical protein
MGLDTLVHENSARGIPQHLGAPEAQELAGAGNPELRPWQDSIRLGQFDAISRFPTASALPFFIDDKLGPGQGSIYNVDDASASALLPSLSLNPWSLSDPWQVPTCVPSGVMLCTAVGDGDLPAVTFYRGVFAPLKSTRASTISAHTVFFDRALNNPMAMHFLLALSHSELAIHQGQGVQMPPISWRHFHLGSQLLLRAAQPVSVSYHQADHVAMMLSFLYMYMFWMRRDPFSQPIIRDLSRSVLSYVQTHGLDDPLIGTGADSVLLCRILTYLYDRDGFCCFFGCGGVFASYVNESPDKRRRIWRLSQRGFPWSSDQLAGGSDECTVRAQDATTVTELYFQLISIHHEVNRYSQAEEDKISPGAQARMKATLDHTYNVIKSTRNPHDLIPREADGKRSNVLSLTRLPSKYRTRNPTSRRSWRS